MEVPNNDPLDKSPMASGANSRKNSLEILEGDKNTFNEALDKESGLYNLPAEEQSISLKFTSSQDNNLSSRIVEKIMKKSA
jgi:hypothetical protein